MSSVLSAVGVCERSLRAIGQFPVTESAADGEQLREAMTWLDLIMAEQAGTTKMWNLIPQTISFNLTNGTSTYSLNNAFGGNLPLDQIQFPVQAFLLTPQGTSVVGFSASLPGTLAVGQSVVDLTGAANIPPGAVVAAINTAANQITLSCPSTVAAGDVLQFNTSSTQVSTGTVGGTGLIAGTPMYHRRNVPLVTRDIFKEVHNPAEFGHPRMFFIDRLPAPTLQIFPTPVATDNGLYIFQLDVQTYAPNVAPAGVTGTQPQGSVQHNFRQAWQRWLVVQLAHDLGSGPITKLPESSLNRFGKMASTAKEALLAYENREFEDTPPVGDAYDEHEYQPGGHYHRHHDQVW